jgi:hypothetical protein
MKYMYLWSDTVKVGSDTRTRTRYSPDLEDAKRGAAKGGGIVERIVVGGTGEPEELWPGNTNWTPAECYGRSPKKGGR